MEAASKIKKGRAWKIHARFSSFEEADKVRKNLKEDKTLEVKVHKQVKGFAVKKRLQEEAA
jgi:hypothetical protein